jgi:mannose/fructose/N-acetylgalactosamine-specific phosphotransferase system component IIB
MTIVLLRIDERLIHGQVVVAWGAQLHPDRIVVVDDALAGSAWEQELYCLGLPADTTAEFASVADARARLDEWRDSPERVIVLARDAVTMARLGRDGLLQGMEVNIGGIHHAPDRREVLPYVFLSERDEEVLRELAGEGADVSARDLPGGRRVPLAQLLSGRSLS